MRMIIVLACLTVSAASAPDAARGQGASHISVAAGAHALTLPWHPAPLGSRLNPAAMLGIDRGWKAGTGWRLFYTLNLGFVRHHWWLTGVTLEPEVGLGGPLPGGLYADVRLGVGYMHYFFRRQRMGLEDSEWVEASELGRPSVTIPLSVSVGYEGDRRDPISVAPFLSARWSAHGLLIDQVPVLSHLQLLGGLRIERSSRPNQRER